MGAAGVKRCMTCREQRPFSEFHRSRRCDECWERMFGGECEACGGRVPVVRQLGRRRRFCDDPVCQAAAHAKAGAAKGREAALRTSRKCSVCLKVKPLTPEFWHAHGLDTSGRWKPTTYCKPCARADYAARYASSAKRRELARARAAKHRERIRARRAADPEFDREYRAIRRAYWRAAKQRKRERPGVRQAVTDRENVPRLPAAPLLRVVDAYVRRGQMHAVGDTEIAATIEDLCGMVGIDGRTYRAWKAGGRREVQFDTADRVLTALGVDWGDVYGADDFPSGSRLAEQLFGGA